MKLVADPALRNQAGFDQPRKLALYTGTTDTSRGEDFRQVVAAFGMAEEQPQNPLTGAREQS